MESAGKERGLKVRERVVSAPWAGSSRVLAWFAYAPGVSYAISFRCLTRYRTCTGTVSPAWLNILRRRLNLAGRSRR